MKWILALIIAFIDPEMSSKKASFDGKVVVLEEEVVLDHPFGKLKTEKAYLEKGSEEKFSFEKAKLEKGVEVLLNTGEKIKSQTAEASVSDKWLKFYGAVCFEDPQDVTIRAKEAEAFFEEKNGKYEIYSVKGLHDVKAEFKSGRKISCNFALYEPSKKFELIGDAKNPCHFTDQEMDIKAQSGVCDLKEEKGVLENVDAQIKLVAGDVKSIVYINALKMHYCDKTKVLSSSKKTKIACDAYGLKSDLKEFKVKLKPNNQLQEAGMNGFVHIDGPLNEILECQGIIKIHEGRQEMTLIADKGESILFKTSDYLLKAAKARLFYKQGVDRFIPIKLEIEEDVVLIDLRTDKKAYGKSHQAEVFLEDQRIHLYGKGAARVLYVDTSQDINLSAPEVVITKTNDGKVSAQGIGAVRFGFNEEERKALQKVKGLMNE